ncbi:hypothetical protein K7X08_005817 [Anisodus acutangulus]|uniref:Beta-glucosidase n=1 Tax=Anisodus acutangulus TaxID=402998 RepID=A0A9Q1LU84_9SOLA|nr:hypothetical protein K7X08_005817 [Anisodus acutangulus]
MRKNVGSRLPTFTKRESELVKGSLDFIGLNHYTQIYIRDNPRSLEKDLRDFNIDMGVEVLFKGYQLNEPPPAGPLPVKPSALSDLLEHFKQVYGNPPIYVHENGQQTRRNATLNDTERVEYLHAYIGGVLDALSLSPTYPSQPLSEADLPVILSGADDVRRTDGSSAYQVEGVAFEDGRMPRIWDTFAHVGIYGGATADEDVKLMADTGLEGYRFSISWSRLIRNGRGPINPKGLQYYNNLIDELISHGIQLHVTLCHSDLPQALEDEYGGWMSRKIIDDFTAYADVCFKEFGDRVLYWTTLNEVNVFTIGGYDNGPPPKSFCRETLQEKLQVNSTCLVGLNLFAYRPLPYTNTTADIIAVQRVYDFYIGWFPNPLMFGDYPDIMKRNVGSRLPKFTREESMQVKGAIDFIALNHYQTVHVKDSSSSLELKTRDFNDDGAFEVIYTDDDSPPGQSTVSASLNLLDAVRDLTRYPKLSAHWYSNFLKGKGSKHTATLEIEEKVLHSSQ